MPRFQGPAYVHTVKRTPGKHGGGLGAKSPRRLHCRSHDVNGATPVNELLGGVGPGSVRNTVKHPRRGRHQRSPTRSSDEAPFCLPDNRRRPSLLAEDLGPSYSVPASSVSGPRSAPCPFCQAARHRMQGLQAAIGGLPINSHGQTGHILNYRQCCGHSGSLSGHPM